MVTRDIHVHTARRAPRVSAQNGARNSGSARVRRSSANDSDNGCGMYNRGDESIVESVGRCRYPELNVDCSANTVLDTHIHKQCSL